jgi:hypothetical protein
MSVGAAFAVALTTAAVAVLVGEALYRVLRRRHGRRDG